MCIALSICASRLVSVKWASEKLLDAIDATVPTTANNADYVAALRRLISITWRPHRLRSLMAGNLDRAFQSVHDGPPGLRPLDEQTDGILADDFRTSEWQDLWRMERDRRRHRGKNPRCLPVVVVAWRKALRASVGEVASRAR